MGNYDYIYYMIIIILIKGCLSIPEAKGTPFCCCVFGGFTNMTFAIQDTQITLKPFVVILYKNNGCRVLSFLKLAPFYVSTYAFVLLFNVTAPFELTPISTGIDVITMFSVTLLA